MRILVSGAGGFVGAHVANESRRRGHELVTPLGEVDAVLHLSPAGVRGALDEAWARRAHGFILLSTVGASAGAPEATRAATGQAEAMVRASGLRWAALRPDILWGPGDVFTNEIAKLLRHLPFIPVPRGGGRMAPLHVGDAATALVSLVERSELWGQVWSLHGPEELRYAEVVGRIAQAVLAGEERRRLSVPAWSVRFGAAVEERVARRPRMSRELVDWRVAVAIAPRMPPLPIALERREMTVERLREYLAETQRPDAQLTGL